MRLRDLADYLYKLPDDLIILSVEPWTPESPCVLSTIESLRIPGGLKDIGYVYFLGVSESKTLLIGANGSMISSLRMVEFLIYYAKNDSFPNWANALGGQ